MPSLNWLTYFSSDLLKPQDYYKIKCELTDWLALQMILRFVYSAVKDMFFSAFVLHVLKSCKVIVPRSS